MKCNRNRLHSTLHCQFNCNRQLFSQLNLEIFIVHHRVMNCGCGGWVSSFIIVCYGFVSGRLFTHLCGFNPGSLWASTAFAANSHLFELAFLLPLAARSKCSDV